jgi:hypothetical protein
MKFLFLIQSYPLGKASTVGEAVGASDGTGVVCVGNGVGETNGSKVGTCVGACVVDGDGP